MSSGGGSSGGSQTVTQVQQIPDWQKDYAQQNENIAASLASRPYQAYQGQMVAGLNGQQQQGINMANQAATSYQPYLNQATDLTNQATTAGQGATNAGIGLTAASAGQWNPQAAQQFMSPYVMQALQPQLQQLGIQQAQQQKSINANATQAGAFGDARHGVQSSLNDFYGNLAQNDLVSQGMNTAYNTGLQAFQQGQQQQLAAGNQLGQLGQQQQTMLLNPASQFGQLGTAAQDLGISGANAVFQGGTQQQQLDQTQLNLAYQNFMNQQNYPLQELNMRIAALANSPYDTSQTTVSPPTNATAMNVGAFGALAGGIGSLLNGSGSSGLSGIFGGATK
jgi:hypothetical protein